MRTSCLFIVDVQKGFITETTHAIPEKVARIQELFGLVFASRFLNPDGSLHRKLIGWHRFTPGTEETELAFVPVPKVRIFKKEIYSCISDKLLSELIYNDVDTIYLCGIATDGCVLKTAVDFFEAGIRPVVLADYCGSHGGVECHEAGLLLLRRFIGVDQVVSGMPSLV